MNLCGPLALFMLADCILRGNNRMSRGLDVLVGYMYPTNQGVAILLPLSLAFLACCLAKSSLRHIFSTRYKRFRTRLKESLSCAPSIDVPHHGLRTQVDCSLALPQSYMIFSGIMLIPSFLSLLRSWQSISQFANLLLHFEFWFIVTDILISAIFVARVILHRFANPPPNGSRQTASITSKTIAAHVSALFHNCSSSSSSPPFLVIFTHLMSPLAHKRPKRLFPMH
jgi:hypothetical protein